MKKFLIMVPMLVSSLQVIAQSGNMDHILQNLETSYTSGFYDSTIYWVGQGISILNQDNQENDSLRAFLLTSRGNAWLQKSNFILAEKDFSKAHQLFLAKLGENSFNTLVALGGLANTLKYQGKHTAAQQTYLQVISGLKNIDDINNFFYANMLNSLAQLYQARAEYIAAENAFREAQLLYGQLLGENHYYNSIAFNNLAHLYMAMGQYKKSEFHFRNSLHILDTLIGSAPENLNYWYSKLLVQENLALLDYYAGDPDMAISQLNKVMQIRKEKLGQYHISYIQGLNNLGTFYQSKGELAQARYYHTKSLELESQNTNEKTYNTFICQLNLARIYQKLGKYDSAELYYEQASLTSEYDALLNWQDKLSMKSQQADFYAATGKVTEAFQHYQDLNQSIKERLFDNFNGLAEAQQAQLLNTVSKHFTKFNQFSIQYHQQEPSVASMCFDNALFLKGLLLNQNKQLKQALLATNDSTLRSEFQLWVNYQEELAKLLSLPVNKRFADVDSIRHLVQQLEQDLYKQSETFRDIQFPLQSVSWRTVQQNLKINEAALEYIQFTTDSSTQYAALIIRKQDKHPQLVQLCLASDLEMALSQPAIENLYAARGGGIVFAEAPGSLLYNLVWQPLDNLLSDIDKVYISPAGKLHQVAFAALPYKNDLLMDHYDIEYLSSTRALLEEQKSIQPVEAALFGGIIYQYDEDLLASADIDINAGSSLLPASRGLQEIWEFLPESRLEVEFIDQEMKNAGMPVQLFTGYQATEEIFKKFGNATHKKSPSVLHLATHGFFIAEKKKDLKSADNAYHLADDPMLRGGLLMAGANRAWQGLFSEVNQEDGVLTGYEVAQLNLMNTDLVVLSACETGLGEANTSEGVYGLQRAFKKAGSRYLIMTLWKIPDKEAREMMQLFYHHWLGGQMDIQTAFRQAQQEMARKYDPYYWAAYVLIK